MDKTNNMKELLVEIKDLECKIGDQEILKGVNLQVNKGEVHAIMGPNGSGKSTLSSVLAGNDNYEITEGSISFLGEDITEMSPEERSWKGMFLAFQYPIEIPGVSNINFLRTALNERNKFFGDDPIPAKDFLKMVAEKSGLVGLDNRLKNRSVNEGFSGGEKKRNEIFQMAMLEPKLAILDETDSGLDIDALKIISKGIKTFMNEDKAIILITHYQRLLDYVKPNFIHVMKDGKIIKTGSAELARELEKKGYEWVNKSS